MVSINPLDIFLWTLRRNEKDVVNLYNTLSPVMQLATGGSMLNFGYWNDENSDPISAQKNLCSNFAKMAELETAKTIIDVETIEIMIKSINQARNLSVHFARTIFDDMFESESLIRLLIISN